ncbi:hypothetical protein [Mycoplasma tullyi]|uniref:hypothetical protein n=1 Tax=Mycoplasma tullyi TaxID=1612150 RepID=UPI001E65C885|nr:hypothetical protein [Mycoplasma tullyi]
MARTKKNKSETKTTKKRGRKAQIEHEFDQSLQEYGPKLLNVKVQSELDQEDDLDFSHKSIVNDENEIFSGEIKTNKSRLKNRYFDTVLDEEDLLQAEFDEIKQKSKKRLVSEKTKQTDQTAQAIKQSINKRFDDFFDETEKALITNTIYDGDYHENQLEDQDLIEKAQDFENVSVLIDEIIYSSLSQEEKNKEEVYDGLAEISDSTNLTEVELNELENLDLNKLDFDPNSEQKPVVNQQDQHVYQAVSIDEVAFKHDVYEPDVLLNNQQPIAINQELSVPTEIKQDLDLDRIQSETVVDDSLVNQITNPIKVEVAEITEQVVEVQQELPKSVEPQIPNVLETQIPKISPYAIQEEIIDIKVHDLTKDQIIQKEPEVSYQPSYQATSEVVSYAVDEKSTDDEIIQVNNPTDKLLVQSTLDDHNIRYEVQQEENTKPKEVHIDVDQLNSKLNEECKVLDKPKKSLDQLEEIPAVIKQVNYVKQEVENIPTNDHRLFDSIKKPLDDLVEIPAVIKPTNFAKQEVKNLQADEHRTFDRIKKSLDQLEEIPATIKQDKFVKQEVENIPANDHRNFDAVKKSLDDLVEIPAVIKPINFAKQEVENLSSNVDQASDSFKKSLDELKEIPAVIKPVNFAKQEVENIPSNDHRASVSFKKSLDELEEIPATIKQDKYVKQEVENIPANDYREFDSSIESLDDLKEIPAVITKAELATLPAKLTSLSERINPATDKFEIDQANSLVDLAEVQKLVEQLEELAKQNQQLLEEKEQLNVEKNDQEDLLENLITKFDHELEQLEELNNNFSTEEFEQDSDGDVIQDQQNDILVEDAITTDVEFKPDYERLNSELLDDTIHPIQNYDSGWKPQELDVKYNYSGFDFSDYHKLLDEQTEFKMFCKKAIDYSIAPTIKMSEQEQDNSDDLIELDHDDAIDSTNELQVTDNVADIEVSDWETIENHPMIDFQSLINKHSEQSKYYLEDKSSTTELIEQSDETDSSEQTEFNFEGLDEDITRLIIEQKENIKHRLISQGEYDSENLSKELSQRLKEETRKIVVKNINNDYTNINDINKFKKPLVSVDIKPVRPFASKSLKDRLVASQKIPSKSTSKKVATKSILNDLKNYQFKGANLIFQKSEPKKLTNNK